MYFFKNTLFISLLIAITSIAMQAQTSFRHITLSGKIIDSESKEKLAGVLIRIPSINYTASSDSSGEYSAEFDVNDSIEVLYSFTGYNTIKRKIFSSERMSIELSPDINLMKEVTIIGQDNGNISSDAQMSKLTLTVKQVKDIPSLLGEKDVIKVLQLLPGVQKGREGSTALYVRGGGPDQNLILLDGMQFYNAGHLYGFMSLFNADVLKDVELTKGAFPARFGGKLSSVLDMTMKEGNPKEFHGEAGLSILSSKLTIEGPINKDKCSFIISARRSFLDLLVSPFLPEATKVSYFFYDISGKLNWNISNKNKLSLSFFSSRDKFKSTFKGIGFTNKTQIHWDNLLGNFQWNYSFNPKLKSIFSISRSAFNLKTTEDISDINQGNTYFNYSSSIKDIIFKYEVEYKPVEKHTLRTGIQVIAHNFEPGASVSIDSGATTQSNKIPNITPLESSIYIEDIYHINKRTTANIGGRITKYRVRSKTYIKPEPRLALSYKLTDRLALKSSYAEMNQYTLLLSQSIIGPSMDLWVPATDRIQPMNAKQVALGIAKGFGKSISFSIETYYKKSRNLVDYKEGSSYLKDEDVTQNKGWETKVTQGNGWTYGSEFLLQKQGGKISGWIGYTLSWNWMQFDNLNLGRKFPAKYDRRHDASVVLIYKPKERFSISANWVYSTGNAYTMPVAVGSQPSMSIGHDWNYIQTIYASKNSLRMPSYHRLDLSIQFNKTLKKQRTRTFEISIYNVYNRQNPYYYFIVKNGNSSIKDPNPQLINHQSYYPKYSIKKVILFPIIPSISYRIAF